MTAITLGSLLYEGKAKRVFATDQSDVVAVEYKDDATAFNALKKAQLVGKGELNCQISARLFELLERSGIPTHYRALQEPNWMLVRPMRIVPVEGSQVSLPELPGGLLTKPALLWKLQAGKGGEHRIRATYQTAGMTWRSDYNLVLGADDASADLTAWVSLMNLSGISFDNARLKLVAGDVQRVQPQPPMMRGRMVPAMADSAAAGFEEQAFFEYHLYTLPRRTDLPANSTQQLTLFPPVSGFEVEKELLYAPTLGMGGWGQPMTERGVAPSGESKASVFVSFVNKASNRLGMPLPAGKVRVFKQDPKDGTLEFIGEDMIDHTPRNETVRLRLGEAFDVVGERKVVDFSIDTARKAMSETIEIEIRNQKEAAQRVIVRERLYRWRNWKIAESTPEFRKLDASTVEWTVEVPAEGRRTIRYRVDYSW